MNLDEVQIPKEIEITIYTQICVANSYTDDIGKITTYPFEMHGCQDEKYITLNKQKIKIHLGKIEIDMRGEIIKGLEEQKAKVEATKNMELKEIQDKIDSLLAIEYKPEDAS